MLYVSRTVHTQTWGTDLRLISSTAIHAPLPFLYYALTGLAIPCYCCAFSVCVGLL